MIDTNFERAAEKSLVMPQNYFDRYRQLLGEGVGSESAFWKVETELFEATGFRKYLNMDSFRHALSREKQLVQSPRVSLLAVFSEQNMNVAP